MAVQNRLRRDNLTRFLDALWRSPGLSRADLARRLRIDRSTSGQLADTLLERGVHEESPEVESGPNGGRPPVKLRIRPGYAYTIGLELTYPVMRLAAVDLSGRTIAYREVPTRRSIDDLSKHVGEGIATIAGEAAATSETRHGLLAVGIGASAVVDTETATIVRSYALTIETPTPLRPTFENGTTGTVDETVPVRLLNDAQTCAIGEHHLLGGADLLTALIRFRPGGTAEDIGIGVGMIMNGRLLHGRAITHILRPADGRHDRRVLSTELGRSLALIANAGGIDRIVLAGDIDDVYEIVSDSIHTHAGDPWLENACPVVLQPQLGEQAVVIGASHAATEHIFRRRLLPIA